MRTAVFFLAIAAMSIARAMKKQDISPEGILATVIMVVVFLAMDIAELLK